MFDTSIYVERRNALRNLLASFGVTNGLAVFIGNNESPMNYGDNAYKFRQDSSFLYFFGVAEPGFAASLDIESGLSTLYGDAPDPDDVVWTGPRPPLSYFAGQAGVDRVSPRKDLHIEAGRSRSIAYLPPYRADVRHELAELTGVPPSEAAANASVPLIRASVALRQIKSELEIAEMERAAEVSVAMHEAAIRSAKPGMREYEVAACIAETAAAFGCFLSFPTIATTHGEILHNLDDCAVLKEGDCVLVDAGAETREGYAGDLSSTFPVGTRFLGPQRDIYRLVYDAHHSACAEIRPGVPFRDVHFAACRGIVEGLKALGVMRGDTEEALSAGAHALFFPCGTGHQIGLDAHDMENYGEVWVGYDGEQKSGQFGLKSLRMAKPLLPGMVVTIEPGVYFNPALVSRWKADPTLASFIDFTRLESFMDVRGVRNEEDWLVTETGGRRLGPTFDKSIPAIERMRAERK